MGPRVVRGGERSREAVLDDYEVVTALRELVDSRR
jgi:hypothetical protein